jgi:hypothetical protein
MFFKSAPYIRPELAKYTPPDTIGHGNAEAVDPISCGVSAGWQIREMNAAPRALPNRE